MLSPSTEFSKLDLSFTNPCFDSNNKTQLKSNKQSNTNKTTCKKIFFKNLKIDSKSIELPQFTSHYSNNSIKLEISKNSVLENPLFNLSLKNLYSKLKQKNDTIDLKH